MTMAVLASLDSHCHLLVYSMTSVLYKVNRMYSFGELLMRELQSMFKSNKSLKYT